MATRRTQAVIIIHGMGEQRPMQTLRSFADAVLPEPKRGGEKYFSKPDRLSELFELRKLQNREQPRTHLFEYYWAYQVEGTTFSHVTSWFSSLLLRRPGRIPPHLRHLYFLSWALLLVAAVAAALGIADAVGAVTDRFPSFLVSAVSALAFAAVQGFLVGFMGDVARYVSPQPRNIKLRQRIRREGVDLLRRITESGDYDRIVIVAHSLGSLVAYDLLKHFWQECNTVYARPHASNQPALAEVERQGEVLLNKGATITSFRRAQGELWRELRGLGNPWLVTDLVTMGSPLAHAALLLADDEDDLRARQRQRELPTCPPIPELDSRGVARYSYRVWDKYETAAKEEVTLRALHHAALFGCTRWTNLYFPAVRGLGGDLVAGRLAPVFGPGVLDIPVGSTSAWVRNSLAAHTAYWRKETENGTHHGHTRSLLALVEALNLPGVDIFPEEDDAETEEAEIESAETESAEAEGTEIEDA